MHLLTTLNFVDAQQAAALESVAAIYTNKGSVVVATAMVVTHAPIESMIGMCIECSMARCCDPPTLFYSEDHNASKSPQHPSEKHSSNYSIILEKSKTHSQTRNNSEYKI